MSGLRRCPAALSGALGLLGEGRVPARPWRLGLALLLLVPLLWQAYWVRAADRGQDRAGIRSQVFAPDLNLSEGPINLSASPELRSEWPQIAVTEEGEIHVLWQEQDDEVDLGSDILSRRRAPGGGSFDAPFVLAYSAKDPALTTWGQSEVAAAYVEGWLEAGGDLPVSVYVNRWDDAAERWPFTSRQMPGSDGGIQPDLSVAGDWLWMTWIDTALGARRPQWLRLRAESLDMASSDALSAIDERSQSPKVAAAISTTGEADIHFAWMNEDLAGSEVNLVTMADALPTPRVNPFVVPNFVDGQPRLPALVAADRDEVCLAWQESVEHESVQLQEIIRMCEPWLPSSEPYNVTTSLEPSLEPGLALDGERGALLVWTEWSEAKQAELRYDQAVPVELPPGRVRSGELGMPDIAYHESSNQVYSVWVEESGDGGSDIWFARWEAEHPNPTPTPTGSATATPSPTRTPSRTNTVEPSPTPPSVTPTFTATPSATPSPTEPSETPSPTPDSRPFKLYAPYMEQKLDPTAVP